MSAFLHIVAPGLFPPEELAAPLCVGLRIRALEKVLARAICSELQARTLEEWLCAAFGVADAAIAPVILRAEGVAPEADYWLCADPVHVHIRHGGLVLEPVSSLDAEEAAELCGVLNAHFAGEGLSFVAPRAERWYLRLEHAPRMTTHFLSEAAGQDIRDLLPAGEDALRWHGVLNEVQMLLHDHPVNHARESRGALPVNSIWLWGGGRDGGSLARPFSRVFTDSFLAGAFAEAAQLAHSPLPEGNESWGAVPDGSALVVWNSLQDAMQQQDFGRWRDAVQRLEQCCIHPALSALRKGRLAAITLDVPQAAAARRLVLTRRGLWRFWRHARLRDHAVV